MVRQKNFHQNKKNSSMGSYNMGPDTGAAVYVIGPNYSNHLSKFFSLGANISIKNIIFFFFIY